MIDIEIGDRLKAARNQKDYTLEEVAKRVGVSRQTICRYEKGVIKAIPSDMMEKLSEALSVSPAYLMGWDDAPQEDPLSDVVEKLNETGIRELARYGEYLASIEEYKK